MEYLSICLCCLWFLSSGDIGSIPGSGRSPGEGNGNPLQYSCLENPHGQRSLAGCSPWGHSRHWVTKLIHMAKSCSALFPFQKVVSSEILSKWWSHSRLIPSSKVYSHPKCACFVSLPGAFKAVISYFVRVVSSLCWITLLGASLATQEVESRWITFSSENMTGMVLILWPMLIPVSWTNFPKLCVWKEYVSLPLLGAEFLSGQMGLCTSNCPWP